MKNKSIIRKLLIGILIFVLFCALAFFGLVKIFTWVYETKYLYAYNSLETNYPNSFTLLKEKFGNDLEMTKSIPGSGVNVTYYNSSKFEVKYNTEGKPQVEFLQDTANEIFNCFHDELAIELEKEHPYFSWPFWISFRLEKGSEYEEISFKYDDFDKCTIYFYKEYGGSCIYETSLVN